MTQGDKDTIAGQTRREYREAKQELAALQIKAKKLGQSLNQLGQLLFDQPENVIFQHQSYDSRFKPGPVVFSDGDFTDLSAENVRTLTSQIRDAVVKLADLRRQVANLEGEDPEEAHKASRPF